MTLRFTAVNILHLKFILPLNNSPARNKFCNVSCLGQWGVLPLADNNPSHTNFYKVSVFTGMRRGAGTKSDICFIMTGDGADSGVRKLEDKKKRVS